MDRSNPYEAAFEAYLTAKGLCYVGVDEKKRSYLEDVPVKNLDFIVLGAPGTRLLIDVKGRRFPGGPPEKQRRVWENWSTQDDLDGLEQWAALSGPGYQGLLVFAYHLLPTIELPESTEDLWTWRGRRYLLRALDVADYRRHMRVRSPSWGTVTLPRAIFRELVKPLHHFTHHARPLELALA